MPQLHPGHNAEPNKALSIWLDLFRWAAALQVVLFHANHRYFVKLPDLPPAERHLPHTIFAALSSFGWPAVMIFFVLSGYLVGGSLIKKYGRDGRVDFAPYVIARLSRLWTVLIPSFFLYYILHAVGATWFADMQHELFLLKPGETALSPHLAEAACNSVFLQTALCEQYMGNGALWSLFDEFWYYIAFPLVFIAALGIQSPKGRLPRLLAGIMAIVLLFILGSLQFVGPNVLGYFGIWLLGAWAATARKPILRTNLMLAVIIFLVALPAWRVLAPRGTPTPDGFLSMNTVVDYGIAIAFANLLSAMRHAKRVVMPPLSWLHAPLAGFSFSLYCIHLAVLDIYGAVALKFWGRGWEMAPQGAIDYLYVVGAILLCLLVAWLFSQATERHTDQVRRAAMDLYRRVAEAFVRRRTV